MIKKTVVLLSLFLLLLGISINAEEKHIRVGLDGPGIVYDKVSVSFDGAHSVHPKLNAAPVLEYEMGASYEVSRLLGHYEISAEVFRHISEVDFTKYPYATPLVTEDGLKLIRLIDLKDGAERIWKNSSIEHVSLALVSQDGVPKFVLFDSVNLITPSGEGLFKFYTHTYRGSVCFYFEKIDGVFPINSLDLEYYLYGVVPKEMPASWNIEALKAQAVCARTYALASLGNYGHQDYDVAPTTHSQVYGGYGAEVDSTNLAVDLTRGEELYYGDERVQCFFHASNGGYMANSEDVFVTKLPYFNAKPDPYTAQLKQEWEVDVDYNLLLPQLQKEGVDIGDFLYIDSLVVNSSRRVESVRLVGTQDTYVMEAKMLRYLLDLDSLYFSLTKGEQPPQTAVPKYTVLSASGKQLQDYSKFQVIRADGKLYPISDTYVQGVSGISTLPVKQEEKKGIFDRLPKLSGTKIYGYGYGHGLGLSQWGAKVMSDQGRSYDEILYFYYDGTRIKK